VDRQDELDRRIKLAEQRRLERIDRQNREKKLHKDLTSYTINDHQDKKSARASLARFEAKERAKRELINEIHCGIKKTGGN
jgi:hypothetical protein